MDRVNLKVSPATAARFRALRPWLSVDAGRMLTVDEAINYLIDRWEPEVMFAVAEPDK